MQNVKVNNITGVESRQSKFISLALLLTALVMIGVIAWTLLMRQRVESPALTVISQTALEEKYGLRVSLVAVTGAGGFVDVRIKMVDGEKAKLLLTDAKNFPALTIDGVILNAPEDTRSQEMRFDNHATMYIMYPNFGSAVMQGTPVTVLFGDTALEPIPAR